MHPGYRLYQGHLGLRDRSLIIGRRGYKTGGGGGVKFYTHKKKGRQSFSHAERGAGGKKGFEVVVTWDLQSFIHAVKGCKPFPFM